jgi:hypothetical protein
MSICAVYPQLGSVSLCRKKTKQHSQLRRISPDNTTSTKTPPIPAYKYRHTPIASPGQHHDDTNNCEPQPGPSMQRAGSTFPHRTRRCRLGPPHPDEGGAEAHAEEVCVWIGARSESWHRHRRTPCAEQQGLPRRREHGPAQTNKTAAEDVGPALCIVAPCG